MLFRSARQRRTEFFSAGVPEPERAVEARVPLGERERALAKLYLHTFGKDSLGATLPSPEISKGDLRRIAKEATSGRPSERATWPRGRPVTQDVTRAMESRLVDATVISSADLERLAATRAEAVKRQLVEVRGLAEERVFIRGSAVGTQSTKEQVACQLDLSD